MNKPGSLQQLRQQILDRQNQSAKPVPFCPKCNHALTVDYNAFFTSEICENCFDHARVYENTYCCGEPAYHHVKLITSSGTVQVKEQCKNCGLVKTSAVGGFTREQKDRLPILDEKHRQFRHDQSSLHYRTAHSKLHDKKTKNYEQQRQDRRESWMKEYSKYLSSPEWRAKRELVLKRDNYKCQCCLSGLATQVHHRSYEFVDLAGNEPCFDLVAICGPCHERIETMKAENRKSKNL